jgi:hypothetical protein
MDLLKVLGMPFQTGSLLFVALSSLLLGLVLGAGNFVAQLMGLWMTLIVLVWLTRYAFRMIDDIANGVREAPVAEVELTNPIGDARPWVHPALAAALSLFHWMTPELPVTPTLVAAALLFPPSIAASAMTGRARDALNPLAVAGVMRGLGPWLAVVGLSTAACVALAVVAVRLLNPGIILVATLELLLLLAYACIGGVVYHRRIELGFAARLSPERRDEVAVHARARELQQLLDDLYRDLRAREAPRAIAAATQWLRGVAPHQLRDDVQALLGAGHRWNEPREYARLLQGLLPVLLQLRQPALAFSVAEAAQKIGGDFTAADEPTAVALIDYALQSGRRRAAERLLDSFLKAHQGSTGPRLAALRAALRPAPDPAA